MKFFTKELYEKMQVSGYLIYWDNEEELEEIRETYKEDGMDYDRIGMENFEQVKPLLLKYLPDSLKQGVYDGSLINTKIPPRELLSEINTYVDSINNEWKEGRKAYINQYKAIEKFLPKRVIRYDKSYSFHDATILSLNRPRSDVLELFLDCSGCMLYQGKCLLKFSGVTLFEMTEDIVGSDWLYGEFHLSDRGNFELQVLLYNRNSSELVPLLELRLVADDMLIKRARE